MSRHYHPQPQTESRQPQVSLETITCTSHVHVCYPSLVLRLSPYTRWQKNEWEEGMKEPREYYHVLTVEVWHLPDIYCHMIIGSPHCVFRPCPPSRCFTCACKGQPGNKASVLWPHHQFHMYIYMYMYIHNVHVHVSYFALPLLPPYLVKACPHLTFESSTLYTRFGSMWSDSIHIWR